MRGEDGKFHILYKVTNQLNNRFYIGKHSTRILEDGYLGSGKRIQAEVKKYGVNNFKREILEFCENANKLNEREKAIVNEQLLQEELCLNLKKGGEGGWEIINKNIEKHRVDSAKGGSKSGAKNLKKHNSELTYEHRAERRKKSIKTQKDNGTLYNGVRAMTVAATSYEAREKRKKTFQEKNHQHGQKNSQYGTMWISNGFEAKKIKKEDFIPDGWFKGRKLNV